MPAHCGPCTLVAEAARRGDVIGPAAQAHRRGRLAPRGDRPTHYNVLTLFRQLLF